MLTGWEKTVSKFFVIPQRVIVSIMGFFAITIAYTLRVSLSLAITEMVDKPHANKTLSTQQNYEGGLCSAYEDELIIVNATQSRSVVRVGLYHWSQELQGVILSAFYFGYVLTHIPGGVLSVKYGGKVVLSTGMLIAALFSLLTPILIDWGGAVALIVARVLVGLGEGVIFPACGALLAAWSPVNERSRLTTLVFAGGQAGTIVGSTISGQLLHSIGWESVFYCFGGLSFLWLFLFLILCYSNPESHPYISDKEKEYLRKEIGTLSSSAKSQLSTPWKAILTSVPMCALICAQIGHNWGLFIMVSDLPKYMSDVLRFSIKENGLYSSLPYVMMLVVGSFSGSISDYLISRKHLSITNARKLFTSIAAIGPAIFLVGASYAECNRTLVVVLFTIGMGFMGTFYSGIKVNNLDLSPNYAGVLVALTNGIGGITGIIAPYIVGVITTNSSLDEWRLVFWIAFVVFVVTTIVFILWASGETQPWNEPVRASQLELNKNYPSINNTINNNNTITIDLTEQIHDVKL